MATKEVDNWLTFWKAFVLGSIPATIIGGLIVRYIIGLSWHLTALCIVVGIAASLCYLLWKKFL